MRVHNPSPPPRSLCQALLQLAVLPTLNAQDVAMVLWGLATLAVVHPPLLAALAEHAREPAVLLAFTPQGLAIVAWSFAAGGPRRMSYNSGNSSSPSNRKGNTTGGSFGANTEYFFIFVPVFTPKMLKIFKEKVIVDC